MREIPKHALHSLRGWANGVLGELSEVRAREGREERFRLGPASQVRWPPRRAPKMVKSLKHLLKGVLEHPRRYGEAALADEVEAAKSLEQKALLLKKFYNEQMAAFGEPEDRPTPMTEPFGPS